jgi:SulP family sulfate permease
MAACAPTVEGQLFYRLGRGFHGRLRLPRGARTRGHRRVRAHIWDISSVQALDMAILKFRRDGAEVEVVGMNEATETLVDRLAIHDKPGALDKLTAH